MATLTGGGRLGGAGASSFVRRNKERPEVVLDVVDVGLDAVESRHVVAAGLVAKLEAPGQPRDPVGLLKINRLDGLHVRPAVENPRLDGTSRRLELHVRSAKRHLASFV